MFSLIATALYSFLEAQLHKSTSSRHFFRLDGFDIETYKELLSLFRKNNNNLSNHPLQIRTSASIEGYENFALEADKSATWYRNHVPAGHALILIFNGRTTDIQSLKRLYRVTETLLSTEGLDYLIQSAFQKYQLSGTQPSVLKNFVQRVRQHLFEPQLRDLVEFLSKVDDSLGNNKVDSLEEGISLTLPYLGLFRCQALAKVINTSKGDQFLKDLHRTAQLGSEILDDRQRNDFLTRLDNAEFMDDSPFGGMSPAVKRKALQRFLLEVVSDRSELLETLSIDWEEVKDVLYRKTRQAKAQKLPDLATNLRNVFDQKEISLADLPNSAQDVLEDLASNHEPDGTEIEQFIADYQDVLGKQLSNKLRRIVTSKSQTCSDFIAGLTTLGIELLNALQDELQHGTVLAVEFDEFKVAKIEEKEAEALAAFYTLYGGIEKMLPAVAWNLAVLWKLVNEHADWQDEGDSEREKVTKSEISFRIKVKDSNGEDLKRAELIWQYRSDSPTAITLANLKAEYERLNDGGKCYIPLYNTCLSQNEINDIDLRQPLKSIGAWYENPGNLRQEFYNQLRRHAREEVLAATEQTLISLEEAWGKFVSNAVEHGVLAADSEQFLVSYTNMLRTATEQLQTGREASNGFRLLTQAWVVGSQTFDEWALVPFLHPFKVHWWRERTRQFNRFLADLLDISKQAVIVDETRFCRELVPTYSSSGYPAVLALPGKDRQPEFFVSVEEVDGYELYRRTKEGTITYGVDSNEISESEADTSAQAAAIHLSRVLQDYIETYPFVRDGVEIYLMQCRDSALPGMLIEQLDKVARKREWQIRITVVVHTTDRGTPLFRRVSEWLRTHEELAERQADAYFPLITFRVLECDYRELFNQVGDTDLIILSDVLAERGQRIEAKMQRTQPAGMSLQDYLPVYLIRQAPLEKGEYSRTILLNSLSQPEMVRQFYNIQWAAKEKVCIPANESARFQQVITLQEWEEELVDLHRSFNWVVCYDTAVDRFLLEDTFPDAVQVIRFSQGLGVKQRHNLTVSSNNRAQEVVIRRLQNRLSDLLTGTPSEFRLEVARRLVEEAKKVSGDIVLRAAGPGSYLNELIGLVAAKYLTESRFCQENPYTLTTWIYLDDFSHWFNRSQQPDLLFISLLPSSTDNISIRIEVLETKCVGRDNFDVEAEGAQRQTIQGVNRLAQAWKPGKQHLDADYWYDQLYRAVVSNLVVEYNHLSIWQAFQRLQPRGQFSLNLTGHSWIFCHDGDAGIRLEDTYEDGRFNSTAPDSPDCDLTYHHFGRHGLRWVLRQLIENSWQIEAPADTWSSLYDEVVEEFIETPNSSQEKPDQIQANVEFVSESSFRETDKVANNDSQILVHNNSQNTSLSVLLGTIRRSNNPCYWEASKQPNGFFLILGASGSGKTETLKVIASEIHTFGVPCLIFDFHGDVVLNGAEDYTLSHGPISTHGINPMELDSTDPADGGVYAQVNILLSMMKACIPSLGHRQWRVIKDTLNSVYEDAGINDRDPNTWTRISPDFGDVLASLDAQINDVSISSSQRNIIESAYDAVSRVFEHPIFAKDKQISIDDLLARSHHLNLVHLEEEVRFVVTDTLLRKVARALKSRGNIPVQPQNDFERFRLFIFVDEAKILSLGGKDRDSSTAVLNTLATEYRKFGLGMVLASQMSDHFSNETKSQIATRLVLKPFDYAEAKKNAQDVNLEADDLMLLQGRGDGYLKMSSDSKATRIQIMPLIERQT